MSAEELSERLEVRGAANTAFAGRLAAMGATRN
jgi:hypothetical protein